jgi:hypothetical protein
MSRYMAKVEVEPKLWRGVVVLCNGSRHFYGPYNFRCGATQAINRTLNEDERANSVIRVPTTEDTWGPFAEFPNPHWRRGTSWYETATKWERAE